MLSPEIEKKMKRYNKIMKEVETLKHDINRYLDESYNIYEDAVTFDDGAIKPFSIDGACPMFEWGSRNYDIKQIKDIIAYIERTKQRTGESPDLKEINTFFTEISEISDTPMTMAT